MRKATWCLTVGMLVLAGSLSRAQSLGDAARAQRQKQDAKKPAKVYTNDDFPSGNTVPPPAPTAGKPATHGAGSSPQVPTITAETSSGASVPLTPDTWTNIIFMATWCPHSKALKDMLNDPRSRPYWASAKLVFVFSKNEWARAKADLDDMAKSGKLAESKVPALLEKMKREAGSPYVMHPDFLDGLPGDCYFAYRPKEVTGYPRVLSVHGYADQRNWFVRDLKMPGDLYQRLIAEYDPDQADPSAR